MPINPHKNELTNAQRAKAATCEAHNRLDDIRDRIAAPRDQRQHRDRVAGLEVIGENIDGLSALMDQISTIDGLVDMAQADALVYGKGFAKDITDALNAEAATDAIIHEINQLADGA